jgi:P2 family phage contractile tail tube protein
MSNIIINKLTNVNVYLNGTSFMGRAEEVDIPEPSYKMSEHKALGLNGTFELPTGMDKMEARIKFSAPLDRDIMQATGNPYKSVQIMVRGNKQRFTAGGVSEDIPVVYVMNGFPKKFPGPKFKQHENAETEQTFSILSLKLTVNGENLYEVDVLNNVLKIAGEDALVNFRNNQ